MRDYVAKRGWKAAHAVLHTWREYSYSSQAPRYRVTTILKCSYLADSCYRTSVQRWDKESDRTAG